MSDLSQDSLLREIDEDIRRERYARLWKRFGVYIIAAVVAVLLARRRLSVLAVPGRGSSARRLGALRRGHWRWRAPTGRRRSEALAAIAADGPAGFAVLAGLRQAALLAESGDTQAARGVYQQVQRTATDPLYRDLAVLREAMLALQGEAVPIDADAIAGKLEPLTADEQSVAVLRPRAERRSGVAYRTDRRGAQPADRAGRPISGRRPTCASGRSNCWPSWPSADPRRRNVQHQKTGSKDATALVDGRDWR